ncbi:MAG: SH3 domain-containing protein, partial [Gemmatimonadaceae bacterium]
MRFLIIPILFAASPILAQEGVARRDTDLLADPGGRAVATISDGTELAIGETRGRYTEVTLEGFVSTGLLGGRRQEFPISVDASSARMRAAATTSSAIVAEMRSGMGLRLVSRSGAWTRVRRTGWVLTEALTLRAAAAAASGLGGGSRGSANGEAAGVDGDDATPSADSAALRAAGGGADGRALVT